MNIYEAKKFIEDIFLKSIADAFIEKWPDTFVKCSTLDKEIYDKSNGHMYHWYWTISNKLLTLPETPGIYEQTAEDNYSYAFIKKMHDDFLKCEDKIVFLLTYI